MVSGCGLVASRAEDESLDCAAEYEGLARPLF